jgi:hypothetical protein
MCTGDLNQPKIITSATFGLALEILEIRVRMP